MTDFAMTGVRVKKKRQIKISLFATEKRKNYRVNLSEKLFEKNRRNYELILNLVNTFIFLDPFLLKSVTNSFL